MNTDALAKQLDEVLDQYAALRQRCQFDDLSDVSVVERQALAGRALAAILRVAGPSSSYAKEAERFRSHNGNYVPPIIGFVRALRDDVQAGHLRSLIELVHADVFADFLEMADHLLESGFKDPAAVLAGSTLESHLRGLCQKTSVATEVTKADGTTAAKKAETMNTDLAAAGVYSKLDQKSVTAWLDLRNKAAHAKYGEYTAEQVAILVAAIRDFIVRHPA